MLKPTDNKMNLEKIYKDNAEHNTIGSTMFRDNLSKNRVSADRGEAEGKTTVFYIFSCLNNCCNGGTKK